MPVTTTESGYYRITCAGCGIARVTAGAPHFYSYDDDLGSLVNTTFRYSTRRATFVSRCRSCERARRRAQAGNQRSRGTRTVLGLGRSYGVEIECIATCGRDAVQAALGAAGLVGWRVKHDGSLSSGGVEIVSPVLSGETGIEQIRTVCRVLRDLGATINRTCGLHVHHDIRDLRIADVKRVATVWATQQRWIDGLLSPSRREGVNQYCRPLTSNDLAEINGARDLRSIQIGLRISRYKSFNLASYGRYGTVEIRQHQGTLDAEKIISWVRFGQGVIDGTLTEPEAMTATFTRVRDLFAAMGDRLDETARTFLTGRAVEFGAVAV